MRIYLLFLITSAAAFIAGCLSMFALGQSSVQFSIGLLVLACVIAGSTLGWATIRLTAAFSSVLKPSEPSGDASQTTGFRELDKIRDHFSVALKSTSQTRRADEDDLKEVKQLLEMLDRRDGNMSRDGDPLSCAARLRSILIGYGGELDANVRQAVSCGREIARATEEMVSGSEVQTDAVNQSTSVLEQLSERIITVCDNADEAMQASGRTRDDAKSRLAECRELLEELKQIQNYASVRERKLKALGQNTKEIESIVQTIGSLSSRTDLLALNASIESVRAGEHGRGFAVVAEEVRTLAEQSAQAVLDINSRIEMVQLEMHQSISVASSEHDQLHQVVKRITATLESLKKISESASESAERITQISAASNQQLRLTQEIVASLERGNSACKKNRSRAEGVHWTSKTLNQVGSQLERTLLFFRIGDQASQNFAPSMQAKLETRSANYVATTDNSKFTPSNVGA